jgi:hypothetical protein
MIEYLLISCNIYIESLQGIVDFNVMKLFIRNKWWNSMFAYCDISINNHNVLKRI